MTAVRPGDVAAAGDELSSMIYEQEFAGAARLAGVAAYRPAGLAERREFRPVPQPG